ncbi:hypothetical protein QRE66_29715 (plasmid) [Bacillus cereus]|nr:hypothetical protein QRE66_29715 [Bacillus cereus]
MKKFLQTALAGIIISGGLLFGTSDAFAYSSKGNISFQTDANSYKGSAVIVVTGWAPPGGAAIELVKKGSPNTAYRSIDVGAGKFRAEFPVRGIPSGYYDVHAGLHMGGKVWHGELTNYIKVNM